jgi:peptide deformylase
MVHAVCPDRKSSFHGRYSLLNTRKNIRKRAMKLSEKFRKKVFINPEIKILHYIPVSYNEMSERFVDTALPCRDRTKWKLRNASAKKCSWQTCVWFARIAQYKYDHLQVRFRRRNKETYSYL